LKEVKLWEFSPVTFAANEKAKIMKMRGLLESVKADKMDTAISLIRSLGAQPSQDTDDIEPSIVLDMIKKLRG
jgi:hypothetical protein